MSNIQDNLSKLANRPSRSKQDHAGAPRSLGGQPDQPDEPIRDLDFHPIRISGEPLSEAIIRERRVRPW